MFVRYAMPFVALTVAAAALSARSPNASIASRTGSRNARITKGHQRFKWKDTTKDGITPLRNRGRDSSWCVFASPNVSETTQKALGQQIEQMKEDVGHGSKRRNGSCVCVMSSVSQGRSLGSEPNRWSAQKDSTHPITLIQSAIKLQSSQ